MLGAKAVRRVSFLALALAAAFVANGALASEAPEGPRLAIARFLIYPKAWSELSTIGPGEGSAVRLVGGPGSLVTMPVEQLPSWSPNGIAFKSVHGEGPEVFVVGANGSGLHRLPGTLTDGDPVFAPNRHEVAFARLKVLSGQFERPGDSRRQKLKVAFSIWAADIEDDSLRPLTPWERTPMAPTSFSPDGTTLAVTAPGAHGTLDALAVRLDEAARPLSRTTRWSRLTRPMESRLRSSASTKSQGHAKRRPAAEVTADLYVVRADGSNLTRLTRDPHRIERWPSWDPSGQRLAYTRFSGRRWFLHDVRPGNALMQINADGTCATKILSAPGQILYGAAWQPGFGRGAGRITC